MRTQALLAILGVSLCGCASLSSDPSAQLTRETKAAIELLKRADPSLKKLFEGAEGYAVFPSVGKGGLIVGGAHDIGQVFEKGRLIGEAELVQVTVGLQIGGQSYAEIIFFETKDALARFKASGLEFSAQVSAVAAAEGVAENAKYEQGVAVFTLPKSGLMAEASVGGQKFNYIPYSK